MSEENGAPSVTCGARGFRVAASPFTPVKLELALVFCLAALLWLVVARVDARAWVQLAIFAGYGLGAMLWLVIRTRRIVGRLSGQQTQAGNHGEK